ncbi:3-succinoylsemialdehyde-pyridine dehydrogenase [Ruegeria sp. THAF57]|uniref:aldehyde dehydrogenase family protein n=1 Tax=Ruegeria sp. THAF57 TaxID=2744555 RepID=UPI0015DEBA60|nr:aldehyde dehydrogenase family protein [Ruegeria sp. THAF57]CAD0183893.1 3-succinoylsemialdehyde-pyridine dehydrogenase [Ruegeria sp. THAF57]
MIEKRDFYIDGTWVAPLTARDHHVINPTNEEPCSLISLGSEGDVDRAVAAARAAFPTWMETPLEDRVALLEKLIEIYNRRSAEMAEVITLEMGAPIDFSTNLHVAMGTLHMSTFAKVAREYVFEEPLGDHAPDSWIIREPVGVCALITPWNWPMNQVSLKVGAAIVTGNTMILKPSEESPVSAMLLAEMIHEAGFPPGVFNLVNGDGPGVGTALATHPDVDAISLTGSGRAGKAVSVNAAETLKRVHLELGGKGANLVFADADDAAVERGVRYMMINSGQSCIAPSRMIVEESAYDAAVETAGKVCETIKVGPANEPGSHIGPVVNKAQFDKIQDLIQSGIDEGARLVAGGPGRPEGMNRGFFVRPTVFADVTPDMRIAREEIFGPVLAMMKFSDEAEAVQMANDTEFGLANYIQTSDAEKLKRVSRRLRSGMVEANGVRRGAEAPFGGMKQSGNGREGGTFGMEDFLEVKVVSGWS